MQKKTIISFLISIILLAVVLLLVDLSQIAKNVFSFGIFPFLVANVLFIFTYIVHGLKWKIIIGHFKEISAKNSILILITGYFANNIFPARIGEVVRALVLSKKTGLGKGVALSTVLVDRITDVIALLLLFFLGVFFTQKTPKEFTNTAIVLAIVFLAIFLLLLFSKKFLHFLPSFFRNIFSGIEAMKTTAGARIWLLSLLTWLAYVPLYQYILNGLGVQMGFVEVLVVSTIISLSALIPSAPGYIGTLEAAAVLALQIFGVEVNTAISFAVIAHLVLYFSTTILGLIALNALSLDFSSIMIKDSFQKDSP